ncbi:MAG: aminotransferase class I/II-fold pyridoxal phosphate-dependent enzyme [Beijerinckiaceae bacterium]
MTSKAKPATSHRSHVAPFMAMDVMREAAILERQGRRIIHMEVGEPGAAPPRAVREAAIAALAGGRIGYTEALGRPSLRQAIARSYHDLYGVDVPAGRIAVTTGSSGGFILAFLALFDPGARIAVAEPGYPAYRNLLDALGLEAVALPTSTATRFAVTGDMIEAAHGERPLDGVLLMSPANPSGTMLARDALAAICETCDWLGLTFISDEIYHGLTYERPADTALAFSQRAVIVNSFSKYYCMTGWRVGWLVLPEELVRSIERLQQSLAISVPYLSQIAAEAAFGARDELEEVRRSYAKNRAYLIEELPKIGIDDFHPVDGAFYIYADIGRFTNDSAAFCKRMLEKAGVAATTGLDFDRARGNRTLRLSFAGSHADMREAVTRLGDWLR